MLEKVSITDMEGKDQDLATTVLTCEGDIKDPAFPYRLQSLVYNLQRLISNGKRAFWLKKVEPWNSVRVTFSIPREAAQRLRQLAEQGDHVLRDLGILSVQIEGDQVITLTLAGRYSEHQDLVLRKSPETTQAVDSQGSASTSAFDLPGTENLPGPSNVEATRKNIAQYLSQQGTVTAAAAGASTSHEASDSIPKRQGIGAGSSLTGFRSPNVVAPASTDLPFLTTSVSSASRLTPGAQRPPTNYGPFPFASMTHAMNTKHGSTPHHQNISSRFSFPHQYSASSQSSSFTSAFVPQRKTSPGHATTPPPNVVLTSLSSRSPGTTNTVSPASTASTSRANIALSSPLLVNLLQSDAQLHSNKMLPPPAPDLSNPQKRKRKPRKPKEKLAKDAVQTTPFVVPSTASSVLARSVPPSLSHYDPTSVLLGHSSSVTLPITSHIPQVPNIHPQAQGQPKVDTGSLHAHFPVGSPPVARVAQLPLHPVPYGSCVMPPVGVQDTRITSSLLKEPEKPRSSPESNPFPSPPPATDGKTKHLINPFTGHLEPMPSDEEEEEESLDSLQLFPDFELDASENGQSERSLSDGSKDNNQLSDTDSGICKSITDVSQSSADLTSSDATQKESPPSIVADDHCQKTGDAVQPNIIQRELKLRLKLDHRSVKDLEARDRRTKLEAVTPNAGCKVDVSFVSIPGSGLRKVNSVISEPKVPPLHISLRGPNSAVVVSPRKEDKPRNFMKDIADHANNIMDASTKLFDQRKPRSARNARLSIDLATKSAEGTGKKITYRDFKKSRSVDRSREQKLLTGGGIIHCIDTTTNISASAPEAFPSQPSGDITQQKAIVDQMATVASRDSLKISAGSDDNLATVPEETVAVESSTSVNAASLDPTISIPLQSPDANDRVSCHQSVLSCSDNDRTAVSEPAIALCANASDAITVEPDIEMHKAHTEEVGPPLSEKRIAEVEQSKTVGSPAKENEIVIKESVQPTDENLSKELESFSCRDKTAEMEIKNVDVPAEVCPVSSVDESEPVSLIKTTNKDDMLPICTGTENALPEIMTNIKAPHVELEKDLVRKHETVPVLSISDAQCTPATVRMVRAEATVTSETVNHLSSVNHHSEKSVKTWPREFRPTECDKPDRSEAMVSNHNTSRWHHHLSGDRPFDDTQNSIVETSDNMCLLNFRRNSASSPIAKIISVDSLPLKQVPQVLEVPSVCVSNSVPIAAMKAGTSIDSISIPSLIPSDSEVYCQSVSLEEERYISASPLIHTKLVTLAVGNEPASIPLHVNHIHTNHAFKRVPCDDSRKAMENGTTISSEESSLDSMDDLSQSPPATCRTVARVGDGIRLESTNDRKDNNVNCVNQTDQVKASDEALPPAEKNHEESLEEKSEKGLAVSPGTSLSEVSNISSLSEPSLLDKDTKEDVPLMTSDCYANTTAQFQSSTPPLAVEGSFLPCKTRDGADPTPVALEVPQITPEVPTSLPDASKDKLEAATDSTTPVASVGTTALTRNRGVFTTSGEPGKVTLIIKSGSGGAHSHSLLSTSTTSGGVVVPFNPSKPVPIKLVTLPSGTSSLSGRSGNSTLFEIFGQSSSSSHSFSSTLPGSASPVRLVVSKMAPVKTSAAVTTHSVSCKTVVVKSVVVTGTSSSIKLVPAKGVTASGEEQVETSVTSANSSAGSSTETVEESLISKGGDNLRQAEESVRVTRTCEVAEPGPLPLLVHITERNGTTSSPDVASEIEQKNMQKLTSSVDVEKVDSLAETTSMQTMPEHETEHSEVCEVPEVKTESATCPVEVDSAISSPVANDCKFSASCKEHPEVKPEACVVAAFVESRSVEISQVGMDSENEIVRPSLGSSTEATDHERSESARPVDAEPVFFSKPLKRKCSENAAELIKACMGVEDNPKRTMSKLREEFPKDEEELDRPRRIKVEEAVRKTNSEAATEESECSSEDELSLSELANKSRARGVSTRSSQRNNCREEEGGRRRSGSGELKKEESKGTRASVYRDGKKDPAKCPLTDSKAKKNSTLAAREARSTGILRRSKDQESRILNSLSKDETNESQPGKRKTRSGGSTDQMDCIVAAVAPATTKRRRVSKDSHR